MIDFLDVEISKDQKNNTSKTYLYRNQHLITY